MEIAKGSVIVVPKTLKRYIVLKFTQRGWEVASWGYPLHTTPEDAMNAVIKDHDDKEQAQYQVVEMTLNNPLYGSFTR